MNIEIQLQKCIEEMEQANVPTQFPKIPSYYFPENIQEWYQAKNTMRRKFGMYALVDKTWTKELAEWIGNKRCLEVMAGAGWLSKALAEHGVQIIATDDYSWFDGHKKINHVYTVENLDAVSSIQKYGNQVDILIMSWPPYSDNRAYKAMQEWGQLNTIIYIGEGYGGCTADDNFHNHFYTEAYNDLHFSMPQLDGLHDYVQIGYYEPLGVH